MTEPEEACKRLGIDFCSSTQKPQAQRARGTDAADLSGGVLRPAFADENSGAPGGA